MDPVAFFGPASSSWGRVAGVSPNDLVSVLRQGRVLTGEVLQSMPGGRLLVGVGEHKVTASTSDELQPGNRYLFEIVDGEGSLHLRAFAGQAGDDGELFKTLRAALGAEQPIGALLEVLAAELERETLGGERHRAARERLKRGVLAQLYKPTDGAEALAARLRHGGQSTEAQWLRLAFRSGAAGAAGFGLALRDALFEDWLGRERAGPLGNAIELALRELLRRGAGGPEGSSAAERWIAGQRLGDLPTNLGALLERALSELPPQAEFQALLEDLRAFELDTLPQPLRTSLARALFGLAPTLALSERDERAAILLQGEDLKTQLFAALTELEPGALREQVLRTLSGLEAEQWLNVARHAAHEPSHWSLPVLDGARWATAHLFVHRESFRSPSLPPGAPVSRRLALALELGESGPVRVELLWREGMLALRVLAADERLRALLESRAEALQSRLASDGRSVRIGFGAAEAADLRERDSVHSLRFLARHNLMDLEG